MKVLTVQQPWAWAIFHGKGIENRTTLWKHRGPLAIHAGTRWSDRGAESPLIVQACEDSPHPATHHSYGAPFVLPEDFTMGAILGVVHVRDAHHEEGGCCAPWGEESYVEHGGKVRKQIVHLDLTNQIEFPEPILNVKGNRGLWTADADLTDAINAKAGPSIHICHCGPPWAPEAWQEGYCDRCGLTIPDEAY